MRFLIRLALVLLVISAARSVQAEDNSHLEYFGFYASAMGNWNYTGDLAPFTNLTWIHTGSGDKPEQGVELILERVQQAESFGVKAVLSIEPFLFANKEGDLRGDADIQGFLQLLAEQAEALGLLDDIAMIYPKDEPFREIIRHSDPSFIDQYVTGDAYEDIHETLVHVNELIKEVFPEVPLGVILSGYELRHSFFSIPENYDWVGFDCYADLFRSCEERSVNNHYVHLLRYMQPHQRLMAVPETWALNERLQQADWPKVLSSRFRHHLEMAISEPRFIAVIPFIWSFDTDNEVPGLGLNRFQELYDAESSSPGTDFITEVLTAGWRIKRGEPEYPNMDWSETENSPYRSQPAYRGGVIGMDNRGGIAAWAINDALPHKALRLRLRIWGERGQLLYKSATLRANADARQLDQAGFIGYATIGRHAVFHQLGSAVMKRLAGQDLRVQMQVFSDGKSQIPVLWDTQIIKKARTPPLF